MNYETTLRKPVEIDGVGLHHGAPVHLRMAPAPPGTGLVFVRTDLENTRIKASWDFVKRVSYATSLMHPKGIYISTTEHLLSTLYSLGVDNAFLELDNIEVPILDGSGKVFAELVETAGVVETRRLRRYMRIVKPLSVESNGKRVAILPSDQFRLECHIFYNHPLVGEQHLEMEVTPETYAREIAPARTFGFEQELDQMRDMGLIRGASLENAVCFTQEGIANEGGLRFADECCRHKALDLIGDLALIGRPLLGALVAEKAGHAMHVELASRLMADRSLYEIVTFPPVKPQPKSALSRAASAWDATRPPETAARATVQ